MNKLFGEVQEDSGALEKSITIMVARILVHSRLDCLIAHSPKLVSCRSQTSDYIYSLLILSFFPRSFSMCFVAIVGVFNVHEDWKKKIVI